MCVWAFGDVDQDFAKGLPAISLAEGAPNKKDIIAVGVVSRPHVEERHDAGSKKEKPPKSVAAFKKVKTEQSKKEPIKKEPGTHVTGHALDILFLFLHKPP